MILYFIFVTSFILISNSLWWFLITRWRIIHVSYIIHLVSFQKIFKPLYYWIVCAILLYTKTFIVKWELKFFFNFKEMKLLCGASTRVEYRNHVEVCLGSLSKVAPPRSVLLGWKTMPIPDRAYSGRFFFSNFFPCNMHTLSFP